MSTSGPEVISGASSESPAQNWSGVLEGLKYRDIDAVSLYILEGLRGS